MNWPKHFICAPQRMNPTDFGKPWPKKSPWSWNFESFWHDIDLKAVCNSDIYILQQLSLFTSDTNGFTLKRARQIVWIESKRNINQHSVCAHYLYFPVYFISRHTVYFPHLHPSETHSLQLQIPVQPAGAGVCRRALESRLSGATTDYGFWGAEWNRVNISGTYKSTARKGDGNDAPLHHNDMKCSLFWLRKGCILQHGNMATTIASPDTGK